ncbi:flagellar biosynthesis anti-sigma factor FlgM [Ewingella sp. S1.OA.A_B6]
MSIERTQASQSVSPIKQRDPSDVAAPATKKESNAAAPVSGTAVTLSDAQAILTKSTSQDINTARVEELKQAIRDGKLTMDTGKIADALLQDTQDYLKNI